MGPLALLGTGITGASLLPLAWNLVPEKQRSGVAATVFGNERITSVNPDDLTVNFMSPDGKPGTRPMDDKDARSLGYGSLGEYEQRLDQRRTRQKAEEKDDLLKGMVKGNTPVKRIEAESEGRVREIDATSRGQAGIESMRQEGDTTRTQLQSDTLRDVTGMQLETTERISEQTNETTRRGYDNQLEAVRENVRGNTEIARINAGSADYRAGVDAAIRAAEAQYRIEREHTLDQQNARRGLLQGLGLAAKGIGTFI